MATFADALTSLLSPDNATRRAAETQYTDFAKAHGAECAAQLGQCLASSQPEQLRCLAAVLLRRLVGQAAKDWPAEARGAVRHTLLHALVAETVSVARKVCHAIAEEATHNEWPELLPHVATALQPAGGASAQCAPTLYFLLEKLIEAGPQRMCAHAPGLLPLMTHGLSQEAPATRIAALRASLALVGVLETDVERRPFLPLIPLVLNGLQSSLNAGNESEAAEALTALVDLASAAPIFFRDAMPVLSDMMLLIASTVQLEFDTRAHAVELLLTLAERAPALVRRHPNVVQRLVPITFEMLCAVDDADDATGASWARGAYDDAIDDDEDALAGEEALERLTAKLSSTVLSPALALASQFLSQPQWVRQRAALAAIARIADGNAKAFKSQLGAVMPAVVEMLRAVRHPRVVYQAVQLVGRLAENYAGHFQETHHAAVVPALCALLADASCCHRVRGHASAAVTSFANPQACTAECLAPHLDRLLESLCSVLQTGSPAVQEEALGAVANVAHVTEADFSKFYPNFMPGVKGILQHTAATSRQFVKLRGRALECVSLIGEAVGPEMFRADATEVMQLIVRDLSAPATATTDSNSALEYMLPACVRICKAIGPEFLAFMPHIMPPLLEALTADVGFSMTEIDMGEEEEAEAKFDEGSRCYSQVISMHGKAHRVTLNTHAVSEMQQAVPLVLECAQALKAGFAPYISGIVHVLNPLVVFKYSEDVRAKSALALAQIFAAAVGAMREGGEYASLAPGLLAPTLGGVMKALHGELKEEARVSQAEAIADVLQACFESGGLDENGRYTQPRIQLPAEQSKELLEQLLAHASASLERRTAKEQEFASGEQFDSEDADLLEDELSEEEALMTNIINAVGYVLKAQREAFIPLFDQLIAPFYGPLLRAEQPALRHIAMCTFVDVIEYCGPAAHKHLAQFAPLMLEPSNLGNDEPELRQVCVYGINQVAKHAPQYFGQQCQQALQQCVQIVTAPEAADDENVFVTENAVSALGTIAVGHAAPADQPQLLALWLSKLPLREDEEEARVVHCQLADWLEQGNPHLLANRPRVLEIVTQLREKKSAELTSSSTLARLGRFA